MNECYLRWHQLSLFPNSGELLKGRFYSQDGVSIRKPVFPSAKILADLGIDRDDLLEHMAGVDPSIWDEAQDCLSMVDGKWSHPTLVFIIHFTLLSRRLSPRKQHYLPTYYTFVPNPKDKDSFPLMAKAISRIIIGVLIVDIDSLRC